VGLSAAAIKLNLDLWQRGLLNNYNSVVDLGSQELHLRLSEFEELVDAAGISDYDKSQFAALANWPASPRCSAKPFYALLGLKEYSCVDMNREHDSIPIDLSVPLDQSDLYGRFDLVTDHGTNEHVFNVAEAYRTMHRLCKKQGMLMICQTVWGGNGYYNFDSSFFEGLAAANGYEVLFASYILTTREAAPDGRMGQFHLPLARELVTAFDWSRINQIGICYVFLKTSEADFQYPYQGSYLAQKQGHYGYTLQFLPEPPRRTYLPVYDATNMPIATKELAKMLYRRVIAKFFRS